MKKHLFITWAKYGKLSSSLAAKIKKSGERFDLIVGIARGGVPLAMVIGDVLGVKTDIVNVKSYTGIRKRVKPKILSTATNVKGKRILLVDDLIEEGDTMKTMCAYLHREGASKLTTAVLFDKPWSKFKADYCLKRVDRWVVSPWERGEVRRATR